MRIEYIHQRCERGDSSVCSYLHSGTGGMAGSFTQIEQRSQTRKNAGKQEKQNQW